MGHYQMLVWLCIFILYKLLPYWTFRFYIFVKICFLRSFIVLCIYFGIRRFSWKRQIDDQSNTVLVYPNKSARMQPNWQTLRSWLENVIDITSYTFIITTQAFTKVCGSQNLLRKTFVSISTYVLLKLYNNLINDPHSQTFAQIMVQTSEISLFSFTFRKARGNQANTWLNK